MLYGCKTAYLRAANPLPVQNYPLARTPTPAVPPLARPRFFLFFDNNNFGFLLYSFHHHIHLHLHIHLHIHVKIVDVRCHSLHTFGRTPLNFRYFFPQFPSVHQILQLCAPCYDDTVSASIIVSYFFHFHMQESIFLYMVLFF